MKKTILLAIAAVSVLCSCNKWLEATSSTQFKADQIFETRDGFLEALSGVYMNMGSRSIYGANTTWKYNDLVCYNYTPFTSTLMSNFQNRVYTNSEVKDEITTIWMGYYNVLANINMILEKMDHKGSVFTSKAEYNWVKGELLGLRAYIHFDIMRLFGTCGWTSADMDKLTVPYVTTYGKEVVPQRTYAQTEEMLMQDINTAVELLADDPVTGVYPPNFDSTLNADFYWNNRNLHFNLYAAKALLARIALWKNDYDTAAKYAQEVLDGAFGSKLVDWVNLEELVSSTTTDDKRNWVFTTEHIFSLEITGLYNDTMGYLIPGGGSQGENFKLPDTYLFLYPNWDTEDISGLEDVRGTACLLKYLDNNYVCYKLYGAGGSKYRNRMPMIKLPEMYMILAEKQMRDGNKEGLIDILNILRAHRGITMPLPYDTYSPQNVFLEEYMREFLNEGQLFYWLKHDRLKLLMSHDILNVHLMRPDKDLVFPYPDDEIYYGRKQEI